MNILTPRWTRLRYHEVQYALWNCNRRFKVVPAGRRSGKTELAKRNLVRKAISFHSYSNGKFVFGGPTHSQTKEIYWEDAKALVPRRCLLTPDKPWRSISESELFIKLWNGARIVLAGLDKPERIEGSPIDGIVLDEVGNMKKDTWSAHVRPAISTDERLGWAWLIGVPEGRNHYWDLAKLAMSMMQTEPESWADSWAYYHWVSADILSAVEIAAARRELDELTYLQEYEGSFVNFTGQAYYNFDRLANCMGCKYDPDLDLILCFDFNVEPGTATAIQEQGDVTCVVAEVYIPRNSNTVRVCDKILSMFGNIHKADVHCYGDATGGARGTAKVVGSDWDIIRNKLQPVFGDRLWSHVGKSNPRERSRINAVNSRCKNMNGDIRLFVNPDMCPHTVEDFEGTLLLEGGSGEIDKKVDPTKTHLTDGIGYYMALKWPVSKLLEDEQETRIHITG